MEQDKKEKMKRRAAATAVAAVASAGVVVGGLFQSPDELLHAEEDAAPLTQSVLPSAVAGDGDGVNDQDSVPDSEDEERRRSPRSRVKAWVWRQPAAVRALVGVPLWCVGWLILSGLTAAWSGVLSPVLGGVLGWLITAALIVGAFVLTVKAAFPELPVKKILNKKTLPGILLATLLLGALDAVLPLFVSGYTRVSTVVRAVGAAGVLGSAAALFIRRENRRKKKAASESPAPARPPESAEEAQKRALRRVREMVDEAEKSR